MPMEEKFIYTDKERELSEQILEGLKETLGQTFYENDLPKLREHLSKIVSDNIIQRNVFGLNPILCSLQTAAIAVKDIGLNRDSVIAILLYQSVQEEILSLDEISKLYGDGVSKIIHGLIRVQTLYKKTPVIESENFRNLLLSFAEDMRVILIMIADRVNLMRQIRDVENKEAQRKVSEEASYLYAPLAHKLGLYQLKSELEDLSLKYLEHDAYYHIKDKLNATKKVRDAYISSFITPVSEQLKAAGLKFHIKGRTKSIHSIWQKMKKQKCGFQPNPKRLRDWLSVPKSNGYECLHITVLGPDKKWVEVQIRTERMDEIAEHGLAAHWRYKGVKAEGGMDGWLASIRSALEAGNNLEVMDEFKSDLYEKEIYVFTPKGDLLKFPKGVTVLDFAYHIHSKIGNQCVGGKINGKNVSFRTELHSGDSVEILTSTTQKPNRDWLNICKSSRAKAKIRLALKETQIKDGLYAKELLERRFKNKKIEIEDSTMGYLIRKLGFKEVSEFYKQIADEKLDPNHVIEEYQKAYNHVHNLNQPKETESAENFEFENPTTEYLKKNDDVLVIDQNLKGLDFSLAKCCHPIYGDPVFGFVTVSGGIKIHRDDCPNAPEMRKRFGYRVVKARWSGKGSSQYAITLRVIGNDDIGIVSNISNIISKDEKIVMRSINIDSHDGLFSGNLVVLLDDNSKLNMLIKKLRTVKGVKEVMRI